MTDGYTDKLDEAGRYTLATAVRYCESSLQADPLQHGEALIPLWEGLR